MALAFRTLGYCAAFDCCSVLPVVEQRFVPNCAQLRRGRASRRHCGGGGRARGLVFAGFSVRQAMADGWCCATRRVGWTAVSISIQDELGRIDINHADGALLARVFQAAGLENQAASALVDKVLDWRDSTPLKRLNGANAQDYRAAGSTSLPRKGPFQSIDELKLVLTMTPDLFRRVEPALTVYSGSQFFDQRVAPREALMALPGMDLAKVATIMAARGGDSGQPGGLGAVLGAAAVPMTPAGRAFTVRTEITRPNAAHVREAVVRLTEDPTRPFYSLVCTKNQASYDRRVKQRNQDLADLERFGDNS